MIRSSIMAHLQKIKLSKTLPFLKHESRSIGLTLGVAYMCAHTLASLMLPLLMGQVSVGGRTGSPQLERTSLVFTGRPNFRDIKKSILERNIFNLEGVFPDEKDEGSNVKKDQNMFDLSAPCSDLSFKIQLVGTLASDEKANSLVLLKEPSFEEADVYRIGDELLDHEGVRVADIQRNKVVFNNMGKKECLQIAGDPAEEQANKAAQLALDTPFHAQLQAAWVTSELGDGFGKIIQSARLVPVTTDQKINGFKIFAIIPDSLFDKAGLKEGDVIVQVNETRMEAEQGFALYQAFMDEREIVIRVLRDGVTPKTLNVRIQ